MFYRKFVTYLLLVLYGVPTALGPYWHTHSAHSHAECQGEPSATRECRCNHHGHAHAFGVGGAKGGSVHSDVTKRLQSNSVSASDSACHAQCAICRFYACPPWLSISHIWLQLSTLVEPLPFLFAVHSPASLPTPQARGPPNLPGSTHA